MQSWQLVEHGAPLALVEGEAPEPEGREVLIRVSACGICHSDLHFWDGYFNLGDGNHLPVAAGGILPPLTMGHEVAGEVVALGREAEGARIGDRCIVYPWVGCGDCRFCRGDEEMLCAKPRFLGAFTDGGYSTHILVPDARYLVAHDGIAAEVAGPLACSGVTAYSALKKADAAGADNDVVIIGLGGLGLTALSFARQLVGGGVIAADIDQSKRAAALEAGARAAVDNSASGASAQVMRATAGGARAAIDFVGSSASAQFGLDCLRKGGTLICVGLYGGTLPLKLALMPLTGWGVRGSYVGSLADLKAVVELVRSGKVPAIPIDGRPLEDANQGLMDLRAGKVLGRVVLKP